MTALYIVLVFAGSLWANCIIINNHGALSMGRRQPFLTMILLICAIPTVLLWDLISIVLGEITWSELGKRYGEVWDLLGDLLVETFRSDYE